MPRPATANTSQRRYRAGLFESYVLLAIVALAGLTFFARRKHYFEFDYKLTRATQSFAPSWLESLMLLVGFPGYPPQVYAIVIAVTGMLYWLQLKWEAVMSLFAAGGIGAVGFIIKAIVNRPRPTKQLVKVRNLLDGGRLSYPSGHVLFFTAFIGYLWFLSYSLLKRGWQRTTLLFTLGSMVSIVGISRVYLGEHWPSDTLAGYLLGTIWLAITIQLYRWGKPHFFDHKGLESMENMRRSENPSTSFL